MWQSHKWWVKMTSIHSTKQKKIQPQMECFFSPRLSLMHISLYWILTTIIWVTNNLFDNTTNKVFSKMVCIDNLKSYKNKQWSLTSPLKKMDRESWRSNTNFEDTREYAHCIFIKYKKKRNEGNSSWLNYLCCITILTAWRLIHT